MGGPDDEKEPGGFEGGFDYGAFEEELVDDPPTDPSGLETEEPEPAVAEDRVIFDRRAVPKGDATFESRSLGPFTLVAIRGRMNESFPADNVQRALKGPSVIDLRDVDRVSSFGVRGWLQVLQRTKDHPLYLSHCSDAIVNQITMMRNFCGHARIHSFLAPYACDECGADFSVLYHAIEDRERIEARRPVDVPCPECGEPTSMDEDPFTYFDLAEHLLDEAPAGLERAINEMVGGDRKNPIEIELDGDRTCVRFNEALTDATRFKRVFNNVEGALTVDLRATPSVDADAADALVTALARLDAAISDVHVEGSPDVVTQRLVERRLDRVQIRSVMTPVVDQATGMSRDALIELDLHGREVAEGRPLSLPLSWARGQVRPMNETLLARVLIGPAQASLTAPPPPPTSKRPVVPEPPPPPPLEPARASSMVPVLGAGVLMLLVVALVGVGWMMMQPDPVPPPPPEPATPQWSSGGSLPPAWAENTLQVSGDDLWVVGRGTGNSVEEAARRARQAALVTLAQKVRKDIEGSEVARGLPQLTPEKHGALAAGLAPLGMLRQEQAQQELENGSVNLVARYGVPKEAYDGALGNLTRSGEFNGIVVAAMPPWEQNGLRLVAAEDFPNVSVGDRVVSVMSTPVNDTEAFERETNQAWLSLGLGKAFSITALHEGSPVKLWMRKPEPEPEPQPALPLESD